jgi:hypothetical protein
VRAQQIAGTDQQEVPEQAAGRGQQAEARQRHPHGARGDRHDAARERHQPRAEHHPVAPAREPAVGAVEVARRDAQDATPPLDRGATGAAPERIEDERPCERPGGRGEHHDRERQRAPRGLVARERQDDLGRERREQVLGDHRAEHPRVAGAGDGIAGELGQGVEHAGGR